MRETADVVRQVAETGMGVRQPRVCPWCRGECYTGGYDRRTGLPDPQTEELCSACEGEGVIW